MQSYFLDQTETVAVLCVFQFLQITKPRMAKPTKQAKQCSMQLQVRMVPQETSKIKIEKLLLFLSEQSHIT